MIRLNKNGGWVGIPFVALGLALAGVAHAQTPPPAPTPPPAKPAPAAPAQGDDFIKSAQLMYHVVACGGGEETRTKETLPAHIDARLVASHCKNLHERYEKYRDRWVKIATPFLAKLQPANLPKVIMYPFGGGDLVSAVATFPDATEYTLMSLEPAGDVRRMDTVKRGELPTELETTRQLLHYLFAVAHSRTDNLDKASHAQLPGTIIFTLAGMAVHGLEPVSLRYFTFNDDGTLRYYTSKDLEEMEAALKKKGRVTVTREVFANVEITFRKVGDAAAPVKTMRHIGANLDNKHLAGTPLLKHLESKGRFTAMTKAASHLLWAPKDFSIIREYLIKNMEWMVSDSTGIPPQYANKAGFVQDTFGSFSGPSPFGYTNKTDTADFVKLWKANPRKDLPFWYGYPDVARKGHMVVTRKP
jgi:hypothetical protein